MDKLVIFIALAFLFISALIIFLKIYLKYKPEIFLKPGMQAPNFSLPDDSGNIKSLSDYLGKKLVIYFYPKDDTPSCIIQAEGLRDADSEYKQKNITVLGVSYDSPESHKKFKEKYHLPFTLLSDQNKIMAQAYGVTTPMGNPVAKRVTFLIDESGKIVKILENFDVNIHAKQILEFFS